MNEEQFQKQLLARLDIVIRILLAGSDAEEKRSVADMASTLDQMGLTPGEIGAILGKASNYVSATLGNKKRAKGKVKTKNG